MIPSFKNGIKRYAFYGIILILAISIIPFFLSPVINSSYVKNKISTFVYQKTGTLIKPSKLRLTLLPKTSLIIKNFNLDQNTGIDVNIDSLRFDIDIIELLRGKITIDKISFDHPVIGTQAQSSKHTILPSNIRVSKSIQNLKKVFDFFPRHQDFVEIRFKNVASRYFKRMDGSIFLYKEQKEIVLDTKINKLKILPSELANEFFTKHFNLKSIEMDQLAVFVRLDSNGKFTGQTTLITPKLTDINDHILLDSNVIESSFILSDDYYQIDIKPAKLNYPDGKVVVHFANDLTRKNSEIKFTGNMINIDQVRETSLLFFRQSHIAKNLFKILNGGVAPNVDVSFNSKALKNLFHENNLKLKGYIENGSVSIPKTDLIASKIFGHAAIKNGLLDINAKKAMLFSSRIEKGQLTIDLLDHKTFPFSGEFLLDVDLSMVPKTLESLLPDTILTRELSLVSDLKGHAKTKLNLDLGAKTRKLIAKVSTSDFKVEGRYDRIPGSIFLQNVSFNYEPGLVNLKRVNGTINDSMISELNAKFKFKDDEITIHTGSGEIDLDSMIPWLMSYKNTRQMILPVKEGTGKINITSFDLTGPLLQPELWTYDVKGNGLKIFVTTHVKQDEIENTSFQYHVSNDFIDIKKLNGKITGLALLEPFIDEKYFNSIKVPLNFRNGNLQVRKQNSFLNADMIFATGPELHIDLKGKSPALFTPNSIKFSDKKESKGTIVFNHNSGKPLFDFTGFLNTNTIKKILIPESFLAKKLDDFTEGQSILLSTNKDRILNIETKSINLNSILFQPKHFSNDKRFLPSNVINFKIENLRYKKLNIRDFESTLSVKKDLLYFKFKKAFLCDLKTYGYINFKKDSLYGNIPFEAENKPNIQDLLTCLFQKNEFMDGTYSLNGNISSSSPKKEFLNKIQGSLVFTAEKGRIYKLTLLSRILSVLNISKVFKGKIPDVLQKGFAYKNITIEADIKDSIIHLNKAIIDGYDMTLIFTGQIDPINDKIDLTCLVAPFKTIDLIIEKIPLVNTLLGGRLISVPVKATGKLSDPTVIPLHPSAVGKGIINMMSTILNTPVKLLDKLHGE